MPPHRARTSKRPAGRPALLGLIVAAVAAALAGTGSIDLAGLLRRAGVDPAAVGLAAPRPDAAVRFGSGSIAVFFTTPSLIYPDVARTRIPPPHERALLADIDAAQRSVDAALYEYNLDSLAAALDRARRRGVRVRVALDRENLEDPADARWAGLVEAAGATVTWEESHAFQHSKFVIVDGRVLWTGSWNATLNDTYRNNNSLLRISAPAIVANYAAEFERFAAGRFGAGKGVATPNPLVRDGPAAVESYFTPGDPAAAAVAGWVGRARRSVEFLAFSFTAEPIAEAMLRRQAAGVVVRGVIEQRNANGTGSVYALLRDGGADVLPDGNCYTMHHKLIIIDGQVVIAGSYNFTGRAEHVNDENMLVIVDPTLARAYQQEFARVYAQARSPGRCE